MSEDPNVEMDLGNEPHSAGMGERMWPLDMALVALSAVVLYVVFTQFRFDDPRWLFNAWTYTLIVPAGAIGLALLMRNLVHQNVQKSIQLGFLTSVFVHLMLLLVAVRWVIFPAYFPEAFTGVKPERTPVRKTVPEYVFETPTESSEAPDWSKPVDTETASRVIPEETRVLPTLDRAAPKMQMPQPVEPQLTEKVFLNRRREPTPAIPQPADLPSQLARRRMESAAADSMDVTQPVAPELPAESEVTPAMQSRAETSDTPRTRSSALAALDPRVLERSPVPQDALARATLNRRESVSMPSIRSNERMDRLSRLNTRQDQRRPTPAASTPDVPAYAVARDVQNSTRRIAQDRLVDVDQPRSRRRDPVIATAPMTPGTRAELAETPRIARVDGSNAATTLPEVADPGQGLRRRRSSPTSNPMGGSIGTPVRVPELQSMVAGSEGSSGEITGDLLDRLGDAGATDAQRRRNPQRRRNELSDTNAASIPGTQMALDVLAPLGRPGLARDPASIAGIAPSEDIPKIASLDWSDVRRPRRQVGGPSRPAGAEVAAVESFNRRVMRTEGGAAQAPAGLVGPATEEAIERGLAYLAQRQNEDGSWSLQGHGEDVILRSDTAATGLCLLAFQGAGYTHKRHQYASVVAKGLDYLKSIQRTNGDLFKPENTISNRNVALYSHGIAALALSEAYGMTQDTELREAAQMALDYIAATQHRRRGGWRYTPQVSADTSVSGWMMMALKSGELSGLKVDPSTYRGIQRWLTFARESSTREDRYRYDPFAPDTPAQRHGRFVTPTMTSVGILMRMYLGWQRDREEMKSAAEYLLQYPPSIGTPESPQRDTYYWYYATQVMFHMGGEYWERWNRSLNPVLLEGQIKRGSELGSWDPNLPVKDRWSPHAGRLYVTAMNLLNLEVYYRHLPIYEDTASDNWTP